MPLAAGTHLGPYLVGAPIGRGGMGEVYRARDTKLDRDVALKVLPAELEADEQRVARFEREAKVLASLNHPNIASIHGLEASNGTTALVLELVEGPTLAELIAAGPLPVEEALSIARQIAEALEAGHEAGVIHRDLKPANVKVKEDGTVKVLDYGLAKAFEPVAPSSEDLSDSPTQTRHETHVGTIVGTAAYMSPEQATGKRVDRRTDVWAFGAVLYEMLTGKRAFHGDDLSAIIAAVLRDEPDWEALEVGGRLRQVLKLCLEKDPAKRARDIGDVRLALDGAFEWQAAPLSAKRQSQLGTTLAAAVLAGLFAWFVKPSPQPPRLLAQFDVTPPTASLSVAQPDVDVAISPDGTRLFFPIDANGQRELHVRDVRELETTHLAELSRELRGLFVSPDGEWLGYFDTNRELKRVSTLGGPSETICELPGGPAMGASWGDDGTIIFGVGGSNARLYRVPADGGEAVALPGTEGAMWPELLPGSEAVLFSAGPADALQVAVQSLESGDTRVLVPEGSNPRYVASGHIVYTAAGSLRAVAFDHAALEVTSEPVEVLDRVLSKNSGAADFAISRSGSLLYVRGAPISVSHRLVWVNRDGSEAALSARPAVYLYPRVSPDGSRLALENLQEGRRDIWTWDTAALTMTRLTFDGGQHPVFSPGGRRVAFGMGNRLAWKSADGAGAVDTLVESSYPVLPQAFTPDGTRLVYQETHPERGLDLAILDLGAESGEGEALLTGDFNESNADISPDGRYLAYQSDESGRDEIWVRSFPDVSQRWQVTTDGGTRPLWSRGGRELFYLNPGMQLMAVPVRTEPTFSAGNAELVFPRAYFAAGPPGRIFDVSPDGERFLMIKRGVDDAGDPPELILVQNWVEQLKRLVPVE